MAVVALVVAEAGPAEAVAAGPAEAVAAGPEGAAAAAVGPEGAAAEVEVGDENHVHSKRYSRASSGSRPVAWRRCPDAAFGAANCKPADLCDAGGSG